MTLNFFLLAAMALAQSPGTFTATGSMTEPRVWHTATLLHNGTVLIAGGRTTLDPTAPPLASAELYDPSTGTFMATGSMTVPRAQHTATVLPDGKVFIAGGLRPVIGSADLALLASTEVYDPATGTFTASADMPVGRSQHTATLLNNGKVLIAGGSRVTSVLGSAELYDPAAATFLPTGNLTVGRYAHLATLLPSGKVLIVPGGDGADYDSAEVYDPDAGTFSGVAFNFGIVAGTAGLLTNGMVLITLQPPEGDWQSRSAALYDSSAEAFKATANMSYGRYQPTATVLSDGSMLIAGSNGGGCTGSAAAEIYEAAAGAFLPTGSMITGRTMHTATLLNDGSVLMAGGFSPGGCQEPLLASAELYHPALAPPPPVLLSVAGSNQGAILHAGTDRIVSAGDPAVAGEALEIYCTGLINDAVVPPRVAIGGRLAEVLYFGKASGIDGLNQVNVRLPDGIAPGPAVPVRLTYLGRHSNEVAVGVH